MGGRRPNRAISFDCYGTLIDMDLDGATLTVLGHSLADHGVDPTQFLHDFNVMRWQGAMEGIQPYKALLRNCLRNVLALHRIEYRTAYGDALIEAIRAFPPFPDVRAALERLQPWYRLAIISNTDDDLVRDNERMIGVEFDYLVTSQQAGAYKPNAPIFEYALGVIGMPVRAVTHVAASYDYDVIPTTTLGMRTVWVTRGHTPPDGASVRGEVIADLSSLPALLGIPDGGRGQEPHRSLTAAKGTP